MDIHEWEIRFQVCLIEGGVETIVEGSVFRWTPDEEEAGKLFLSQWKRTYRKNKDWFAALVNDTTGIDQAKVQSLKKSGVSPDITIIEIKPSKIKRPLVDDNYDGDYMTTKLKKVPRRVLPSYKCVKRKSGKKR